MNGVVRVILHLDMDAPPRDHESRQSWHVAAKLGSNSNDENYANFRALLH